MVVIDRVYAGGAVQAVVQGSMTPTVPGAGGTFTVDDDTGWPVTGKFAVRLNRGLSDEEHIVCDSRAGKVFTVGQRGADGTNAQSHDDPTCEIYWDARSANLVVDHIDDVEADPHSTKLLNNARHDLPARHTYGASAALGTRPTPVSTGTANSAGSGSNPSAGDHQHAIGAGSINSSGMFAAGVVDAAAIGTNAVGSDEIAANAVGTSEIVDGAVNSAKILDGTIVLGDLSAALQGILIPIGGIVLWGTNVAPTNFQLLDGSAISRTTFATLFSLWGTTFGAGNGSTTFNVPDLRQRFPLGKAASGTGVNIGDTGGAIDHAHSLATPGATAHAMVEGQPSGSITPYWRRKTGVPSWTATISTNAGGNAQASSIATTNGAELGGDTDTANPPFLVLTYIVRTL